MNGHFPSSLMTKVELDTLTMVPTQIISPSRCQPIIQIVQDTLTGAYLLTQDDVKVTLSEMKNLMMFIKNFNGEFPEPNIEENGIKYWSGKQLYSMILPDISLEQKNNSGEKVIIKRGQLLEGSLDKTVIGTKGLIQNIFNMYGIDRCKQFLDDTQMLITRWLENRAFSVGLGDGIPLNKEMKDEITKITDNAIENSNKIIAETQQGTFQPNLDDEFRKKSLEVEMNKVLTKSGDEVANYINSKFNNKNRFKIMVQAGSKGSNLNIQQIVGSVGQQSIWGQRVENGFTDRTLPHFHKNDYGARSKGFVQNSFMKGMMPHEFFFHMMGGRTGSIDTAVKTSESGYLSRRLMKALEDVKIMYDGTVRNSANNIIQFTYGDDDYDPIKLEKQPISLIELSDAEIEKKYKWDFETEKDWILPNIFEKINNEKDIAVLNDEFNKIVDYRQKMRYNYFSNLDVISINVYLPFNLYRFIYQAIHQFHLPEFNVSDLNPVYVANEVDKLCENIVQYSANKDKGHITKISIRTFLSSKNCIMKYKLSKQVFDYIIKTIYDKIMRAYVQPGEMVGPVAAQSIGEVSTQLTLNTFHAAGVGAKSVVVTSGVPRLKEIINVSKKIKTPSMIIYLKNEHKFDSEKADYLKSQLEYTVISDVIKKTELIYDDFNTSDDEDLEFLQIYQEFNDLVCADSQDQLSKWMLRFEFNREMILNKNISMIDIQKAIYMKTNNADDIQCIVNDDNSSNLILRIRIRYDQNDENSSGLMASLMKLEKDILSISIRGVKGLKKVEKEELSLIVYGSDGTPQNKKEWTLNTDGTNLAEVLMYPYVDTERTISNDIYEIYELFGIEAARNRILYEINQLLSSDGVNYRHLALLADLMTNKGIIMQIDRHGINRLPDNGVITKATFEEVNDMFVKASIYGEHDKMNGVAGNLMMGQFPKGCGTNAFEIVLDEEILEKYGKDDQIITYENDDIDPEIVENEINTLYKNYDTNLNINDEDFDFNMGNNIQEHRIIPVEKEEGETKIIDNKPKKKIIKKKK